MTYIKRMLAKKKYIYEVKFQTNSILNKKIKKPKKIHEVN